MQEITQRPGIAKSARSRWTGHFYSQLSDGATATTPPGRRIAIKYGVPGRLADLLAVLAGFREVV